MDRRSLIAAGTAALAGAAATSAAASDKAAPAAAVLGVAGVGLPVIEGGRLRNYVFVSLRLHLGAGRTPEQMRAKEPFLRDALVKAAHRTPFTVPGDWTRLNEQAMAGVLMSAATTLAGRGAVTRVEFVAQNPRRRSGMPTGR